MGVLPPLAARRRDLLPLPAPDRSFVGKVSGVSRAVARRLHSRAHRGEWLCDAVDTINSLGPCPTWGSFDRSLGTAVGASGPPLTGQLAVRAAERVSSLRREIARVGPPPSSLTISAIDSTELASSRALNSKYS